MIKRALISVSDKTNIIEFAKNLSELGISIISTGGTYKAISEAGVRVQKVSEITGFPEILNGRVKTLHPYIHGGILAMRNDEHRAQLKEHGIDEIDLVVVNLYPFENTIAKENCSYDDAVENIDIGGPTMLRSAAKNHKDVAVVVDPVDYKLIYEELKKNKCELSFERRKELAFKAFRHTASYDAAISNYFQSHLDIEFPDDIVMSFQKKQDLRYGENPHQKAAFYEEKNSKSISVANSKQLWGKELSYNNILDLDAAISMVSDFLHETLKFSCIIKHSNPCGAALASSGKESYIKAVATDPVSYFGGIVGCNFEVNAETAEEMAKSFLECIIAPSFTEEALAILKAKKNIRIMTFDKDLSIHQRSKNLRRVRGGILVQDFNQLEGEAEHYQTVTDHKIDDKTIKTLDFAWKMVKHVKSNAIVFAKDNALYGVGAGQMSRVDSVEIAVRKAEKSGLDLNGSVLASDAFFPFRDGIDAAASAGVIAVIQPGGSVKDPEVIQAANEKNIGMIFTGNRHFNH
jgi:phosphoribosylaminoimidazolecarboxamide formyltransferase / IMP cyclohydrolase